MKFIIENRSDLDELNVLNLVYSVISSGRISNDGKQYCYMTTFDINGFTYAVSTDLNKNSDRFVITKRKNG